MKTIPGSKELEYVCLGSGSNIVTEYFDNEEYDEDPQYNGKFSPDNITTKVALQLAITTLKKAAKDSSTGGLIDLAVITQKGVTEHGPNIHKELEAAESQAYQKLFSQYE